MKNKCDNCTNCPTRRTCGTCVHFEITETPTGIYKDCDLDEICSPTEINSCTKHKEKDAKS